MTEIDLRNINLRTLKRIDPSIGEIIESSSQSALYTFDPNSDKWFKQEYEGCLHLFERFGTFSLSSSNCIKLNVKPRYGFMILDQGSVKHYTEDIKPGALVQMIDTNMIGQNGSYGHNSGHYGHYGHEQNGHNLLMFTSITGVVHCFWFSSFDECEKMLLAMKSVSAAMNQSSPSSNGSNNDGTLSNGSNNDGVISGDTNFFNCPDDSNGGLSTIGRGSSSSGDQRLPSLNNGNGGTRPKCPNVSNRGVNVSNRGTNSPSVPSNGARTRTKSASGSGGKIVSKKWRMYQRIQEKKRIFHEEEKLTRLEKLFNWKIN